MSAYREIVDEARAQVAAGRDLDADALAERIRTLGAGPEADRALAQLERIVAVHRARTRVAAAPPRRGATFRTRPSITANMEVRRRAKTAPYALVWDAAAAVTEWEVRFSERPDPRADYVVRETRTLPGTATEVELPLSEHPLRVHVLGRRRDGRLLRRAVISGLTEANWNDRWQHRASAA